VKHVTVNADQTVVTNTVVAGKTTDHIVRSPALLTDSTSTSMPALDETRETEPIGGNEKK
jgi:hypothetical protein